MMRHQWFGKSRAVFSGVLQRAALKSGGMRGPNLFNGPGHMPGSPADTDIPAAMGMRPNKSGSKPAADQYRLTDAGFFCGA